jgi:hypothetical protein
MLVNHAAYTASTLSTLLGTPASSGGSASGINDMGGCLSRACKEPFQVTRSPMESKTIALFEQLHPKTSGGTSDADKEQEN